MTTFSFVDQKLVRLLRDKRNMISEMTKLVNDISTTVGIDDNVVEETIKELTIKPKKITKEDKTKEEPLIITLNIRKKYVEMSRQLFKKHVTKNKLQ